MLPGNLKQYGLGEMTMWYHEAQRDQVRLKVVLD
jgi:hypothetical protein